MAFFSSASPSIVQSSAQAFIQPEFASISLERVTWPTKLLPDYGATSREPSIP